MRRKRSWLWGLASVLLFSGLAQGADAEPAAQVTAAINLDTWRNLQGGLRRDAFSLANAQLGLELDAEGAVGWRGGAILVSAIVTARPSAPGDVVGDLHGLDNKDAQSGARLLEAWARQAFPGGYAKAGSIDLNTEFSVNRTGVLFINGAQGLGLETAQLGWGGPSVYPRPRAGLMGALEGRRTWKLGLFAGAREADPALRRGQPWLAILEASQETGAGGRVSLGLWRHSAHFGSVLAPVSRHPGVGGYLLVEHPLWRGARRRLDGFARLGLADAKTQQVASDLNLGLVLARPFTDRAGEALGLAVLSSANGDHFRRAHAHERPARRETVVEATWRLPIGDRLALQPDVQYVIRPGALRGVGHALVVGLRLEGVWSGGL
ncbi:carbohydrate porin [Phenylobacterium sp. LjRoot225]|uniref:carbohydrate porin n=1 Tax=Phenylobacterium sp. LjRoot225 TaxID=3342285 RepID=UPI003ECF632F